MMSDFCSGRNYFEKVFLPYFQRCLDDAFETTHCDVDLFLSCFQKHVFIRLEQIHVDVPPKTVNPLDNLRIAMWTFSGQMPYDHVVNKANVHTYQRAIKLILENYAKQLEPNNYWGQKVKEEFTLPSEFCLLGMSEFILEILQDLENNEIQARRSTPYVVKFNESSKSLNVDGNSIPLNDMEIQFTKAVLVHKTHKTEEIAVKTHSSETGVRQTAKNINDKVRSIKGFKNQTLFNGRKYSVGYVLTDAFEYQT